MDDSYSIMNCGTEHDSILKTNQRRLIKKTFYLLNILNEIKNQVNKKKSFSNRVIRKFRIIIRCHRSLSKTHNQYGNHHGFR